MEGFGQTETTLTIATYPWVEPKPGSMGIRNPQYDIDLLTNDGRWAEDGEQGQIVIRTDKGKPLGLFKEYYRDPEKTQEAYHDNIYYTGDVAWRDEDGYFWFVGRADDVIKSSGYRIGPFEVESALMTHPAVVECAITGVPDEVRGQVVKATIVLAASYKERAGEDLIKNSKIMLNMSLHLINILVSLNLLKNCLKLLVEKSVELKYEIKITSK